MRCVQLCIPRKVSVAYDAACYIKHVVKSNLKKNNPSTWPGVHRDRLVQALTKRRSRPIGPCIAFLPP